MPPFGAMTEHQTSKKNAENSLSAMPVPCTWTEWLRRDEDHKVCPFTTVCGQGNQCGAVCNLNCVKMKLHNVLMIPMSRL